MTRRCTRRGFLATSVASAVSLAGCVADAQGPPVDVRGAMYLPARAMNSFQMWHTYERGVTERDMGFATRLNLNALRTWLSYEAWHKDRESFGRAVDHFLRTAESHGIRVMLGIFEGVGRPPVPKNLYDTDPWTGTSVWSPGKQVMRNPDRWSEPTRFAEWVMNRYRDDERVLAIEVMNEPGWRPWKKRFAREMFRVVREERGDVPLTVGATSLANVADYYDWGVDVMQFHYNYPNTQAIYRDVLEQANKLQRSAGMPVWLTEWQRIANFGWGQKNVPATKRGPRYASLVPPIREAGVGNFFWSLMLKPAYMLSQRKRGILNGVFHEDGAVWSKKDARAIKSMSGDDSFSGEQRKEWPEWANEVPERANSEES
ncbi:Cellulase (glycosyl hydrolase family 5) [Haladaptatus litoreus]|uniref:Cellulase (Glycosyl hydrolase family 5) n=1 Tax=Haladaptatus litoreus TaxID=553468 RepID=A0A1N6VKI3_9EURY|nr:cellulase family glycosylhydrolase [Haladaptatus litoreus]SIQ78324.1 Cellulase (glycosyl hydrolase family 5) [Haladaptatus litoreus]